MKKVLVALCTLGLLLVGAVPAQAERERHGYLALGDSVAFGTDPNKDPRNATLFHGYPDFVSRQLDIENVNPSCPGEATGGFIDPNGLDNVCRPYRAAFPLHVAYTGTQLAFAESFLRSHPRTRLVTIDLGANDIFALTKMCGASTACFNSNLPVFLANMDANLRTIFAGLRGTGYRGLIVALTYYALNYADPASVAGAQALNNVMADAAAHSDHVLIADGFTAFQAISLALGGGDSCAAGLRLVNLMTGQCDVHPTPLGHTLLATAIVRTVAASCLGDVQGCLVRHRD